MELFINQQLGAEEFVCYLEDIIRYSIIWSHQRSEVLRINDKRGKQIIARKLYIINPNNGNIIIIVKEFSLP